MPDKGLILSLECDANTTYILDIHIYRERIVDLKYPVLRNRGGIQTACEKKIV